MDHEYSSMIKTTFKIIGVLDIYGPYTLKHTAITKLVKMGVELPIINKSARYALNSTIALKYYTTMNTSSRTTALLAIKESKGVILQDFQNLTQISNIPFKEEDKDYEYDELYHEFFGDDEEIENMIHSEEQKKHNSIRKQKIGKVKNIKKKIFKIKFKNSVLERLNKMEKKNQEIKDLEQEKNGVRRTLILILRLLPSKTS
jgi:hypothetical protein